MLLLIFVPMLNIILLFMWSFGGSVNPNKKNFARASIILCAISFVFMLLASGAIMGALGEIMSSLYKNQLCKGESAMSDTQDVIRWEISAPIFKNTVILKQLGIAIGIPFGLVALVIVPISGGSRDTLYALGLIAALLILTWLFIMAAYRGKYEAEFVLDNKGVLCRTQAKQAKRNRIINALTVILGILSGKPTMAGAGMLAQSRQEVFLQWNHVTKVKFKPKNHIILLRGGWTENIALFCTDENYTLAEQFVLEKTRTLQEVRRR